MQYYDSGSIYEIEVKCYCKSSPTGLSISVQGNKTGTTDWKVITAPGSWGWKSVVYSDLSLVEADLDAFRVSVKGGVFGSMTVYIACMYVIVRFHGDTTTSIVIKNLDTATSYSNNMGAASDRNYYMSQVVLWL